MQVTIFGATGQVGRQLVRQALAQGHVVKAFARNTASFIDADLRSQQFSAVKGYVFEPGDVKAAVHGSTVVLSALGGSFDGSDKTRSLGMKNIVEAIRSSGAGQRVINVGNMGILPSPTGHGLIMEQDDFPAEYLPVSEEHRKAFASLQESGIEFLTVAAPDLFDAAADDNYITWTIPPEGALRVSTGNIASYMLKMATVQTLSTHLTGISNKD